MAHLGPHQGAKNGQISVTDSITNFSYSLRRVCKTPYFEGL